MLSLTAKQCLPMDKTMLMDHSVAFVHNQCTSSIFRKGRSRQHFSSKSMKPTFFGRGLGFRLVGRGGCGHKSLDLS